METAMTESINKCRGCIVGSRIHREVYVRFRGEGSETCCRETVRRRILSLRYRADTEVCNYYSIANDSFKIGRFANVMKYSMYKTFACKYKTNVHEIKRRYCRNDLFTLAYETKGGTKTTNVNNLVVV